MAKGKRKQVVMYVPIELHEEAEREGQLTRRGTRKTLEEKIAALATAERRAETLRSVIENLLEKAKAPSLMDAEDVVSYLRAVLRQDREAA